MIVSIDVTEILLNAISRRPSWPHDRSVRYASEWAKALGGTVDWEPGDESWARVIRERHAVVLVYIEAPLAFVLREALQYVGPIDDAFTSIELDSFHTSSLSAQRATLEAFARSTAEPVVNPASFSALDLWYLSL